MTTLDFTTVFDDVLAEEQTVTMGEVKMSNSKMFLNYKLKKKEVKGAQ